MVEQIMTGGIQFVPQIAVLQQIIYLDFDGELTSYNGEILALENVEVQHSSLTEERINNIVTFLNGKYVSQNVVFVTERPVDTEYSTIFIGQTAAFDSYGNFAGLAETIDEGNANKSDNAFVNLDTAAADSQIIATISHETDHLLGTLNHGGDGLAAYAAGQRYDVSSGVTSTGITLGGGNAMYVYSGGTANCTTVNSYGYLGVCSGGTANSTTVNSYSDLYVYSGGTANCTTLNSGGLRVSSGGTANSTTVKNSGWLYVESGGTANCTTVNSGGGLRVSSGGNAYKTTLLQGGMLGVFSFAEDKYIENIVDGKAFIADNVYIVGNSMHVSSGGTANNTTVNGDYYYGYGELHVSSGGTANCTTVSGGDLYVYDRGTANSTTVDWSGNLYVYDRGTANSTTLNGGILKVSSGGTANSTTMNSGGHLYVYDRGTANSTTLNENGNLVVSSGGTANNTTVNSWGHLYVYDRGTANNTTVNSWGYLYVSSGGTANSTTVNSVGWLDVSSGGTANSTTVNSWGNLVVSSGGTANSTTVNSSGYLYVYSGGTANSTTVNTWGELYVYDRGTANNTTVNSAGGLYVSSGGTANSTTVNSGGYLYVSSGGNAYKTTLLQGGQLCNFSFAEDKYFENIVDGKAFIADNVYIVGNSMHVSSGGTANSTTVKGDYYNGYGYLYVSSGGTANSTTVDWHSYLYVESGGTANNTTVNYDGYLYVYSGGTANNTTVQDANLCVSSGGMVNHTTLQGSTGLGGWLCVDSGGIADNTIVNFGGFLRVSSGGTANNTTVIYGGELSVCSGGTVNNTTVDVDGVFLVSSGCTASCTEVNSYGSLYIERGAAHRGNLQIAQGASVRVYAGATVDFTVSERSTEDGFLINDLSLISGTPSYTITVSADQTFGTYKLAQGAENFTGSISIGDGTVNYGEITVNGSDFEFGDKKYSLKESEGDLTLSIMDKDALIGNSDGVTFPRFGNGIVQYSRNNFENVLSLKVEGETLDSYGLPKGTYQWQVSKDGKNWTKGENIVSQKAPAAEKFISDADGCADIFFAASESHWGKGYAAEHQSTGERVFLKGLNRLDDIFKGSADANVLVLTDDSNGDALFVDDIYTALGNQARFSQIDEIRAGAGDDIVDMTSQRFTYEGSGVTIYGGAGNDTLWANKGSNTLFGDAGDDRLVGASGNDYIIGGAGDDLMSGGGGNDIFCFGGNWGNDTVEQLAGGSVTLWFEEGSNANWNSKTKTYSDGVNTVTVISADSVTLKFGDDASLPEGAFLEAASEKIFEVQNKGFIA